MYLSTHRPHQQVEQMRPLHITSALPRKDIGHPDSNRVRLAFSVIESCAADLQAARLLIKAEGENDGTSRLESFSEQAFDGCAVLGVGLSTAAEEKSWTRTVFRSARSCHRSFPFPR